MVLEVALCGFGRAGRIHYKNLMKNRNFKLTHIMEMYDISKEIPEEVKYVNYNDKNEVNEIFNNQNIKAIIIASPTSTHYELIIKSLNSQKNVFVGEAIMIAFIF